MDGRQAVTIRLSLDATTAMVNKNSCLIALSWSHSNHRSRWKQMTYRWAEIGRQRS